jgi:NADH-quinone oxidoreductase subunit I
MYGWGVIRTLAMALYHFLMSYVEDARWWLRKRRGKTPLGRSRRPSGVLTRDPTTVRRTLPERSRNLPLFVIDAATQRLRCTACGICAQICPVQCIWIERAREPETGKPLRYPVSYNLDISLCMGCGLCAEFCPFDAIKMDQDFELASYTRPGFVSAKDLAKPEAYHAEIHPTAYSEELET